MAHGRKPAHIELSGGKGPRQRVWEAIRRMRGAEFDLLDVNPGDVPRETVRDYVLSLTRADYLEAVGACGGPHDRRRYRLANDAGLEAPRVRRDGTHVTQGLAQEQMWRTLRRHTGDVNARELAAHAGTSAAPVSPVAAADYLRNLHTAGYLAVTAEGRGAGRGGVAARYRLRADSNTGARAPMVCRSRAIYDPNLGRIVWLEPVTEEDAIYGR